MFRLLSRKTLAVATAATMVGLVTSADAAVFVTGDSTTIFAADGLLIDDAQPSGGADSATVTSITPARNLAITTGIGPQTLTVTGIGLNFRGGTVAGPETVTVTVTYFGADNNFGLSADNVLIGSATAELTFTGTNEYVAVFDDPIVGVFDGEEDRFRIAIESTGNMRFKTHTVGSAPSGEGGIKISLGGSSVPVPEPGSLALVSLGGLLIAARRRKSVSA
ncbi:MAG: PEP-CTERM sorting domain-containing protein [Planctomycetota bacterium]